MNYKHSPRGQRRYSGDSGTPKSQKKVRIQDEIEVQETQNYIQDLSENETNENESNDENLDPAGEEETEPSASESKSPKSILKGSQKAVEEVIEDTSNPVETKPVDSKSDTGSLKKKFKNPLQRIKKMADQQFKKVKSNRPFIKKISVSKDEILLSEDLKILKLKESPKSQHREIPSYVEKRDSEDSVEIMNLDESPMESRKRRENESHVVIPDEIIELPKAEAEPIDERQSKKQEATVESQKPPISEKVSSAQDVRPEAPKKRDHVYEDIDEYIAKITSDSENVDFATFQQEPTLERQEKKAEHDPIFEEFSREMNKQIRRSLSIQDDSIRQELAKRIPKIEELEKQISDEDKEEKIVEIVRQAHLLAPISSIDSTSSDESRRQLSIVNEESEASDSNKKKSFDDSSVEREVESLKNDGSDISTTLIEDPPKVAQGEDVVKTEIITDVKPLKSKEQIESKDTVDKMDDTEQQMAEDAAVKEDVVVKHDADASASTKVNKRWSKMRLVSLSGDGFFTNLLSAFMLCDIFQIVTLFTFRKFFKQRKTFKGHSQLRQCVSCFAVWR